MLELSRSLNPECEHVHGDMRTLRLGLDVVDPGVEDPYAGERAVFVARLPA